MEQRIEELEQELAKEKASSQEIKSNYYLLVSKFKEKDRELAAKNREILKLKKEKNELKEIIANQNSTIQQVFKVEAS